MTQVNISQCFRESKKELQGHKFWNNNNRRVHLSRKWKYRLVHFTQCPWLQTRSVLVFLWEGRICGNGVEKAFGSDSSLVFPFREAGGGRDINWSRLLVEYKDSQGHTHYLEKPCTPSSYHMPGTFTFIPFLTGTKTVFIYNVLDLLIKQWAGNI